MPRLSLHQTNFTAGELSPRMYGRTDIDRYNNAAKTLENAHPVIHGGAVRRAGTRFAQETKTSAKRSRVIEFIFSKDLAYMLEFGDYYVRMYSPNGVYLGVELVTLYSEAMLADIDYAQGADTMFLFHPSVPPQRLRRFTNASWDLSAVPFTVQPFDEIGISPATTLTLSALTGTVTATASASAFLPSDVGRNIVALAGIGMITGYTSATVVTVAVSNAFLSLSLTSGNWNMDVSPQGFIKPTAKDPAGSVISVFGSVTRAATLTLTAKTGAITINASASVFVAGDTGKILYGDSGQVTLTYVSATQCTGTTTTDFLLLSYPQGAWGITESLFRTTDDIGKFIRVNGGLLKLTAFVSASQATATIITAMSSIVASPPLAWTLESSVWNAANGYPRTGTLHEQRLWCAGSTKYPQTIWGSRTALYYDFTKGTADSDACIFTISSDEINPISYLASNRTMLIHTYGGELSMAGGQEKPITPTNVQIKPQTGYGSKIVRPLVVGKESIFVQRSGRKVRAMSYAFQIDGYQAPDLTVLAEHITAAGVVSMAYQQDPDQMLWLVLGDGALISCTLDRDQQVNGWARHYTEGAFESVATIPIGTQDQIWVIVRRTVNGVTKRYVEYFDNTFQPIYPVALDPLAMPPLATVLTYGCTTDCSLVIDNATGQTTFTGLGFLEGKTVDIVADGSAMMPLVVTGGAITLPRPSKRTLIGLHFKSTIKLLTPEVGTGTGTAQGNSMSAREITMRFKDTLGAEVMDGEGRAQEVPFRHLTTGVLDKAPPLYSGLVRIEMLGWERGRSEISIIQNQPLPMQLLSVVRKLTVND